MPWLAVVYPTQVSWPFSRSSEISNRST